jgi:hypothetical protein
VLVRADLPLAGQLVQAAYVCLAAGRRFAPRGGCHLVVLSVPSVSGVLEAAALAPRSGVRCTLFEDRDETPRVTAACTGPIAGADRRAFRRFAQWSAPAIPAGRHDHGRDPPGRP